MDNESTKHLKEINELNEKMDYYLHELVSELEYIQKNLNENTNNYVLIDFKNKLKNIIYILSLRYGILDTRKENNK